MGEIYTCFSELKKQSPKDWFTDKVGLVKLEYGNKNMRYILQENAQTNTPSFIVKTTRLIGVLFTVLTSLYAPLYYSFAEKKTFVNRQRFFLLIKSVLCGRKDFIENHGNL